MGTVWAMIVIVVLAGVLFFVAMTGHQWGLFGAMVVCLAVAGIFGSRGSIPRGQGGHDSHY